MLEEDTKHAMLKCLTKVKPVWKTSEDSLPSNSAEPTDSRCSPCQNTWKTQIPTLRTQLEGKAGYCSEEWEKADFKIKNIDKHLAFFYMSLKDNLILTNASIENDELKGAELTRDNRLNASTYPDSSYGMLGSSDGSGYGGMGGYGGMSGYGGSGSTNNTAGSPTQTPPTEAEIILRQCNEACRKSNNNDENTVQTLTRQIQTYTRMKADCEGETGQSLKEYKNKNKRIPNRIPSHNPFF